MLWMVHSVITLLHNFFSKTNLLAEAEQKRFSRINLSSQVQPPARGLGTTFLSKPPVVTCSQLLSSWRLPLSEQEAGCGPTNYSQPMGCSVPLSIPKSPRIKSGVWGLHAVIWAQQEAVGRCQVQVCSLRWPRCWSPPNAYTSGLLKGGDVKKTGSRKHTAN